MVHFDHATDVGESHSNGARTQANVRPGLRSHPIADERGRNLQQLCDVLEGQKVLFRQVGARKTRIPGWLWLLRNGR